MIFKSTGKRGLFDEQNAKDMMSEMGNSLERLTKEGVIEELFAMFHNHLNSKGLIVNEGKMVDASFTTAPRQRITPDENKTIKECSD